MEERKALVVKHLRSVDLEKHIQNPCFQKYILLGEKSGVDIKMVTDAIQERQFFLKFTSYKQILNKLKDINRTSFDYDADELEHEARNAALKEFVLSHVNDHRNLMETIPKSLQEKAFKCSVESYSEFVAK